MQRGHTWSFLHLPKVQMLCLTARVGQVAKRCSWGSVPAQAAQEFEPDHLFSYAVLTNTHKTGSVFPEKSKEWVIYMQMPIHICMHTRSSVANEYYFILLQREGWRNLIMSLGTQQQQRVVRVPLSSCHKQIPFSYSILVGFPHVFKAVFSLYLSTYVIEHFHQSSHNGYSAMH